MPHYEHDDMHRHPVEKHSSTLNEENDSFKSFGSSSSKFWPSPSLNFYDSVAFM